MLLYVATCYYMSLHVATTLQVVICQNKSRYVAICHDMSNNKQNNNNNKQTCRDMSPYVVICRHVSRYVVIVHYFSCKNPYITCKKPYFSCKETYFSCKEACLSCNIVCPTKNENHQTVIYLAGIHAIQSQ